MSDVYSIIVVPAVAIMSTILSSRVTMIMTNCIIDSFLAI